MSYSTLLTPTTRFNRASSAYMLCCISSRSLPILDTILSTSPTSCAALLTSTRLKTELRLNTRAFLRTQIQRSLNPHFRYAIEVHLMIPRSAASPSPLVAMGLRIVVVTSASRCRAMTLIAPDVP